MMDEKKSKSEIEKKTESKKWRKGGSIKGKPHPKKPCIFGHCPNCDLTPPYCANPGTLWQKKIAENEKVLKTAILTLGMNILTLTKVKDDSEMVF